MMRKPWILLLISSLFWTIVSQGQQIGFVPDSLIFQQPVITTDTDSLSCRIVNNSCGYIRILYAKSFSAEFRIDDSSGFWLAPSASKTFRVKFLPHQNIEYNSALLFHSDAGDLVLPLKGYGKFKESYYDNTYNKFEEDLKTTLKSITGAGYISLGYNGTARDHMFLDIDNKKVNGQGATQNTCECVYTGVLAVGYTTRQEMQTNYNFNTEHTFPQSKFSQNEPMRSDIHHLFPTNVTANSQRGDKPFGYVSSPSWSAGGSKTNSSTFEPRDFQKGRTARALMYFVTRYQDYAGFFAPQEALMRQWNLQFPVDSIELRRNNDIYTYQKNRNPFIDHPEYLERINALVSYSTAPVVNKAWCDTTVTLRKYFTYDTLKFTVSVYNPGNVTLNLIAVNFTQNILKATVSKNTIDKQSSSLISVSKNFDKAGIIDDTLLITNSSIDHPVIKIPFHVQVNDLKITATPRNICDNDKVDLTVSTFGVVLWNSGETGNKISKDVAGAYYASVTDSSGCHRTDTISIAKFPKPAISLVKNSKDTLMVTASAPVKWYRNDTFVGSGFKLFATVSGKYWAIATDPVSLCSVTSDTIIYFKTGISSKSSFGSKLIITPNPNPGIFSIRASGGERYSINNAIGQKVFEHNAENSGILNFDLSNFPDGIYFIQSSEGSVTRLIIKR